MNNVTRRKVYKDVVKMPISKPNDVTDNGHCGNRFIISYDFLPPTTCRDRTAPERLCKQVPMLKHKKVKRVGTRKKYIYFGASRARLLKTLRRISGCLAFADETGILFFFRRGKNFA